MAQVVGGMGIAHTPSMGIEYDRGTRQGFDPRWQHWFDGTRPVHQWLQGLRPSQLIVIYNDHLNHFDFRAYPTFAIGVGDSFPQADEGWGLRAFPDLPGDPRWGLHLAEFLVREEDFDLTVCQDLSVDHGVYSWLPYIMDLPWSVPVTPIAVNMIRQPLPTSRRLCQLGTALRRAVDAFDSDERVLIVATGGMSHQISGARFGIANEELDRYFLRTLPQGLNKLVEISQEDYMRYGGTEAVELALWFAMRAALSAGARSIYSFQTFPQITGCGVLAMEEPDEGGRGTLPARTLHDARDLT